MKITLPKRVRYIIDSLEAAGYEAYAVGGCVRDSILGKAPSDWDICTIALPEECKKVFAGHKILETGIRHGTITLILEHIPYEITTYRTENGYSDRRRPDSVNFVKSLSEDLKRRDFTVNAMAYNSRRGLVDEFCGCEDLEKKVIRCVGNPDERFAEDALRIMRAIRFAAALGFELDSDTDKAVQSQKMLLKSIAAERINTEFTKTLISGNPELLYKYKEVISVFLDEAQNIDRLTVNAVSLIPHDCTLRLAVLMTGIYRNYDNAAEKIRNSLIKLKYDKKTVKRVSDIVICSKSALPDSLRECRLLAGNFGLDTVYDMACVGMAFARAAGDRPSIENLSAFIGLLDEISLKKLCIDISGLNINGKILMTAGIKDGASMGQLLKELLAAVIDGRVENKRKALLEYAKTIYGVTDK
jgi:tRNA nucleotidyltransferase (CCA-adding enzyme)